MIKKILIANRGEIACRVIKTARKMNIDTVAIYSEPDKQAKHVRMATQSFPLGGQTASESYLCADKIIEIAKASGADAIHPGYGFLSENAEFADLCAANNIIFIGPSADAIRAMGLKDDAKALMTKAGVPVVPGYQGENQDADFLQKQADEIGYPILIKAVAGGGGKGMRLVEKESDFKDHLQSCQRESKSSFGNDHVLIEKYITKPRHIEVQVFGDNHGGAIHLFERDCSLQRRHQKVIEEAPAPGLSEATRTAMGKAATNAVKSINYNNAGTIEFIVDTASGIDNSSFYFMEMNTRLQVEHPVTEMITNVDLVEWQIRVAAGEKLPLTQNDLSIKGHAFEVRIYAEDPSQDFIPQIGKLTHFHADQHNDNMDETTSLRIDTGVEQGDSVTIFYDPMIAKIITYGKDRIEALSHMRTVLAQTPITGLTTNQEFLSNICNHEQFQKGQVHTGFIEAYIDDLIPDNYGQPDTEHLALLTLFTITDTQPATQASKQSRTDIRHDKQIISQDPWGSHDNWRVHGGFSRRITWANNNQHITCLIKADKHYNNNKIQILINDTNFECEVISTQEHAIIATINGNTVTAHIYQSGKSYTILCAGKVIRLSRYIAGIDDTAQGSDGKILASMPGRIIDVLVKAGDHVEKDQPVLIMEAMKMEMTIRAGQDGIIDELPVSANDQITDGTLLISIAKAEGAA